MSKPKRLIVISLVIIIIGATVAVKIVSAFNAPSSGQLTVGTAKTKSGGFDIDLTPTTHHGRVVSFNYPRALQPRATSAPTSDEVDKATFTVKDITTWVLAVDVTNTGQQPLTSTSDYALRAEQPANYQLTPITIGGKQVPVFTDVAAGSFDKVAFLQQGNYRATVSLIGDDSSGPQPLQTTFLMVLNSFDWKQ